MNQWIQKQSIQGTVLKGGNGGGRDSYASVCDACVVGGRLEGWGVVVATMRSLVASIGEQART